MVTSALSSGAKAVGAAIGAITIGVLLFLLLRSYQQRDRVQRSMYGYGMGAEHAKAYETPEMSSEATRVEMYAALPTERRAHELYAER